METIFEAQSLTKKYRDFKALDDFTMHIPKGSIYGFVGRNGAGKTTLIRILCGLQAPTQGTFSLYGCDCGSRDITAARRRMGALVETPSIYLNMTAEENLRIQAVRLGLPSDKFIPELLAQVGLSQVGKKKARHFSLGMRQRLGIAVALVGDPDFLVLDEPITGLDPQGIIDIRELILLLHEERQLTVLISSHILGELSRLATHYGFIDHGHMVKEVSAQELENACRKCTHVEVTDTKILARVLDAAGVEFSIENHREANIFQKLPVSQLVLDLHKEGCDVLTMTEQDETLESYYMNLVGGTEQWGI